MTGAREPRGPVAGADSCPRLLAQMYAEVGRQRLFDGHPQEAIPYLVAAREQGLDHMPLRPLFGAASRHLPSYPCSCIRGL